jgi:hypothetical protein
MMVITSAVLSLHQRAEAGDLAARADLEALAELLGPAAAR